jgi:caffeoyl-CoA O-methyltransferase
MTAGLISDQLGQYLAHFVPERPAEMQAMEARARRTGFPIIGPAAGYFCYQITRLIGARTVFELGSGFGYSTAWFARAVRENGGGTVYHVVWDQALSDEARQHLGALGFGDVIQYRVSEAVQALGETPGPFDLLFVDICKECYPDSLPVIKDKLRPGGVLLVDNMLWGGRVLDESDQSSTTQGIREFTHLVLSDPAWIPMVVPIRDGVLLAYKQGS